MPLTKRQIYRRRRIAVFGGAALALGIAFYLPFTLLAPLSPVTASVLAYEAPAQPEAALSFPAYGASGIGAVGFPGVLASAGRQDPVPIASITKIITALVVTAAKPVRAGETGPEIRFSQLDEQFYRDQLAQNGLVKPVRNGQVLTETQVLSVMLLASANNYAMSLATWGFGSETAFLAAAKDWLSANGLTGTTITDPIGIDPSNTSTVTDLVAIAKLAMADPLISSIVALASVEIPGLGVVSNRNVLLGVDGIDGIKTGTLDESGACLLFSADHVVGAQTITVVGVVLGGPDHATINASIRSLLAQVVDGFHEVPIVAEGDEFASFRTPWGDTADAVAASGRSVVAWSDTPVSVLVQVDEVVTAAKGAPVGEVTFTVGEQRISVELELDSTIDDPGPWWRLGHPVELF